LSSTYQKITQNTSHTSHSITRAKKFLNSKN
jgi:hypothetical protein